MCSLFSGTQMAKINQSVCQLFTFSCILIVAAGCTSNVANNTASNKSAVAKNTQVNTQQQVVVINKPRKTAGAASNRNKVNQSANRRQVKDQHHVEYDKKRMWYNQQWLAQQEAAEQQRVQRLQYQRKYEERLREQEQLKQRQQAQARWEQEQQRQQSLVAGVNVVQRSNVNQYQQRQAQIEARQQQYNWRQDGGWNQAQVQVQQRAQQQRIRQQHQQRWQHQQRLQRQRVARARQGGASIAERLSNAAIARTYHKVHYDGRYIPISYPMGDVPSHIGCLLYTSPSPRDS